MEFIKVSMKVKSIHYEGIEETHRFVIKADSQLIKENQKFFYSMKKVVAEKVANDSWNSNQIDVEFSFTPMTEAEVLADELNCDFKGIAATPRIGLGEEGTHYVIDTLKKSIDHIADRIASYQHDETVGA